MFINCNWVITRWQCLLYMSANMKMVRTNTKMVNTKLETRECTDFPKIWELPQNSRRQKRDTKRVKA